jgi:hypothetical protein
MLWYGMVWVLAEDTNCNSNLITHQIWFIIESCNEEIISSTILKPCVYVYRNGCACIYISVYIPVYIYLVYLPVYAWLCICMLCIYVYMYVCAYVRISDDCYNMIVGWGYELQQQLITHQIWFIIESCNEEIISSTILRPCLYVYRNGCACIYRSVYLPVYIYLVYLPVYAWLCICMLCMYVCMYVCMCV